MNHKETTELLPCPFCGGTSAFVERLDYSSAYVQCDSDVGDGCVCMARGPVAVQDDDGEDIPGGVGAIAAWNRRAAMQAAEPVEMCVFGGVCGAGGYCVTCPLAAQSSAPSTDIAEDARKAARYEFTRTLHPADFQALVARNIAGEGKFDDLVDAAIEQRKADKKGHV